MEIRSFAVLRRAKDILWTDKGKRAKSPFDYESRLLDVAKNNGRLYLGFVGEWKGNTTRVLMKCKNGHYYTSTTNEFLTVNRGCKKCVDAKVRFTEDQALERVRDEAKRRGNCEIVGFIGGYKLSGVKNLVVRCFEHGEFKISLNNFVRGRSCPGCKSSGYKTSRPGHIYIQKISGVCNAIKFGITNLSPEERMKQQQRKSILNHEMMFCWEFDDGRMAYLIENEIKRRFKGVVGVVPKEIMDDGFTETLPIEILPNFLKDVKSLCNEVRHGLIS
ncbi:hypothetical protein E8Z51_002264 [Escherichia coli]|nr:hypothetical protein [Escherichia coli]EEY8487648.1 hypothetical protein [Escherichia coli]EEZ9984836.1 hypothetical protein [Escherichia coli]EFK3423013.1 hypothetical protein [Escherichia coli]